MAVETEGSGDRLRLAGTVLTLERAPALPCARQWRGFLEALKHELASVLPEQELARVMNRVGKRFACAHPLQARDSVPQLQEEMNRIWAECDWGRVEIAQTADGFEITHQCSQLVAAFGAQEAVWSTGYLRGIYQQWFERAGVTGSRLVTAAHADSRGTARFRLILV